MIADHLTIAAGAGVAQALTSLDNLAVLFSVMLVAGALRATAGYVLSQVIVIAAALAVAVGADDMLSGVGAGYLGLVPLVMGIWGLIGHFRRDRTDATGPSLRAASSILAQAVMFLGLSTDSFAVLTPLLIDTAPRYRSAAVIGVLAAVAVISLVAVLLSKMSRRAGDWATRAEILGPCVMVLAGIYILMDSGTDAM